MSGQVPAFNTAAGSGQVPTYNTAIGSGQVPAEYLHVGRNINTPEIVGAPGNIVIPGNSYPEVQTFGQVLNNPQCQTNVNNPGHVTTGNDVIRGNVAYPRQQNYVQTNNYVAAAPTYMHRGTSVGSTQNIRFSTNIVNVEGGMYPQSYTDDPRNIQVMSNGQLFIYTPTDLVVCILSVCSNVTTIAL